MSKWLILKNLINDNKSICSNSIHQFQGFKLISYNKIIWKGYIFTIDVNFKDIDEFNNRFIDELNSYISLADCSNITVIVNTIDSNNFNNILNNLSLYQSLYLSNQLIIKIIDKDENKLTISLDVIHLQYKPLLTTMKYISYFIPGNDILSNDLRFITRENDQMRISKEGILSNKLHGIDNTGNVCIWPAESILLHLLLSNYSQYIRDKDVLELGGGNTALCGLGLAASNLCHSITITDGHPNCVSNQKTCIHMNKQCGYISQTFNIHSRLLKWSNEFNSSESIGSYDLIILCDCLFFKEYHNELIETIKFHLNVNGKVLLLQPLRDNSMNLFIKKAQIYFNIEMFDNYCDKVSQLRDIYRSDKSKYNYNDDVHYPILLVMTLNNEV